MSGFNIFSNKFNNLLSALNKKDTASNKDDVSQNEANSKEGISSTNDDSYLVANRSLWRAVILQAIIDIVNNSSRTENKIAKIEAKQWVFKENDDFYEVCHLAGYTVKYVRKKIMEIMRQNLISKIVINKMCKEEKFIFNTNENCSPAFDYEKKVMLFG